MSEIASAGDAFPGRAKWTFEIADVGGFQDQDEGFAVCTLAAQVGVLVDNYQIP
jgi:hypothetical protein